MRSAATGENRRRRGRCLAWAVIVLASGGCHQDAPVTVTVVSGGATYPEAVATLSYDAGAAVSAMADDLGDVVVGTDAGAFTLGDAGLEALEVYQDSDETLEAGAVLAVARRGDGLILAADGGIFVTYQGYLLLSPLTETATGLTIRALAVSGAGDDAASGAGEDAASDAGGTASDAGETVWIAADQGLYRATDSSFDRVDLPGEDGAPSAVGALEATLLVAYGPRLYEVSTLDWSVAAAPDGLGDIRAIRVEQDTAWLASDRGLIERSADGLYTRYTLAGGDGAEAVEALTLDWSGRPVVLVADGIIRLEEGVLTGLAGLEPSEGTRAVASDLDGNVWVGDGSAVTGWLVGQPASFAADVAPLFSTRCNYCHLDGVAAPAHDFTDYNVVLPMASTILERIATGQMPPPEPLPDDEYAAVLRWYTGGQSP